MSNVNQNQGCHLINIYKHHLSNDLQSAYKRFHSNETALLKRHNDIVDNMDSGKVTALTLLKLRLVLPVRSNDVAILRRVHVLQLRCAST